MSEATFPGENEAVQPEPGLTPSVATSTSNWSSIEQDPDFQQLIRSKRNFILPAAIVFLVYYFGFLILVGYFPDTVDVNIIGNINLAYLFALSQFILAWLLVYLYVRRAGTFDRLTARLVAKVKGN